MSYRTVALAPLLLVPLLFVMTSIVPDHDVGAVLAIANELGKVIGLVGGIMAALAFERGEYLWRAWLLYGSCYALLLLADAVGFGFGGTTALVVGGALVVLANALSIASTWMLARAWTVAGFEDDPESKKRKWAFRAVAVAIVVLITAWPLVSDARALVGGNLSSIVSTGSDLGDMLTLALIAPVMQTALAMRGGLLRWPWGLTTAGSLAWLMYDITSDIVTVLHVTRGPLLVGSESVRLVASGCILAAGVCQRRVVA